MQKDLFSDNNFCARPFLYWMGSKRLALKELSKIYPQDLECGRIKNYYEPFLGSGAVYFDIIQRFDGIEAAYLSDKNEDLILTYIVVKNYVFDLLDILSKYLNRLEIGDFRQNREVYYSIREEYNLEKDNINYKKLSNEWVHRAAKFIFLVQSCYLSEYAVNQKGEFNKGPLLEMRKKIAYSIEQLPAASKALQKAIIYTCDFRDAIKNIKPESFVYLDPPYFPVKKGRGTIKYTKDSFGPADHIDLANLIHEIDRAGNKFLLSNSYTLDCELSKSQFFELYKGYNYREVPVRRNSEKQLMSFEMAIFNYSHNK